MKREYWPRLSRFDKDGNCVQSWQDFGWFGSKKEAMKEAKGLKAKLDAGGFKNRGNDLGIEIEVWGVQGDEERELIEIIDF